MSWILLAVALVLLAWCSCTLVYNWVYRTNLRWWAIPFAQGLLIRRARKVAWELDPLVIDTTSTVTVKTPWATVSGLQAISVDISGNPKDGPVDMTVRFMRHSDWELQNKVDAVFPNK